jgi:hypothetical protein
MLRIRQDSSQGNVSDPLCLNDFRFAQTAPESSIEAFPVSIPQEQAITYAVQYKED